jgi:hypothetical protein
VKKKATVFLALISMCLIVTAGIGAVSACTTIVGKINPDGTTTVIETFEGCSPMGVMVTTNEDGSINITKIDRQISEEERHLSNAYKGIMITPETELPVNIVNENFSLTAYVLEPYEKIDKDWRRGYYTTANNYSLGTGAKAWDSYSYPFWW